MTPGARVAAAIAVLDQIATGQAAEAALTHWARASRFAGAKDRAAVRDYVYDVLRMRRSLGGGTGRALMARLLAVAGADLAEYFNGNGHAPAALDPAERAALDIAPDLDGAAAVDLPDWLWPIWQQSLGAAALPSARALQHRADVFLRVNPRRADVAGALDALAADQIACAVHPDVPFCLRVTQNARRIKTAAAYLDGLVELQDAASQRAVRLVPVAPRARILDYCAGGGGKALAFASQHPDAAVFAHDIAHERMRDILARAARAGVTVTQVLQSQIVHHAPFDLVFCDAPCSGSGTWRRTPDAKWRLDAARLDALAQTQDNVIASASRLVNNGGTLAYATCSVLECENDAVIARFLRAHGGWQVVLRDLALPSADGDGFFLALLQRNNTQ